MLAHALGAAGAVAVRLHALVLLCFLAIMQDHARCSDFLRSSSAAAARARVLLLLPRGISRRRPGAATPAVQGCITALPQVPKSRFSPAPCRR